MLGSLTLRTVYTGQITSAGGVGPKTLTGALVGDQVINVSSVANASPFSDSFASFFETTITVNDQIQQVAPGDLGAVDPLAVFLLR